MELFLTFKTIYNTLLSIIGNNGCLSYFFNLLGCEQIWHKQLGAFGQCWNSVYSATQIMARFENYEKYDMHRYFIVPKEDVNAASELYIQKY